ncbi:MAG: hypothetical protein N2484_12575 [Clostridia bacterium]|nr:hypothetical protein [Clostridia bacterium]
MYVVYIRNYKRKMIFTGLILALGIFLMAASGFLLNYSLLFNVTINDFLKFSYPVSYKVDNIYINESLSPSSIETNAAFKRPLSEQFSTYNSLKGKFSFNYPSAFMLNQEYFTGSDILYHIDYHDKDNTSHGFVQVWNLPYSLEDYLENSKKVSNLNYKYFNSKPITVNGVQGFYWDYAVIGDDGVPYKSAEVFLQKGEKMYRISYFTRESLWTREKQDIFWRMVNSFKVYSPA